MKHYVLSIILICTIILAFSCNENKDKRNQKDCICLPYMSASLNSQDTVVQGEEVRINFFFSDTTFMEVEGMEGVIEPAVFINDIRLKTENMGGGNYTLMINTDTISDVDNSSLDIIHKQLRIRFAVPHPKGGDLEFNDGLDYWVVKQ